MTLTIIKNGSRDFTHVTEFANMTFGYYSMVLNNTLQTVVIKMPNGAQFPNDAISIIDVFFQDNTDTGDIESFATTELLKARLIEVDYNGLVEASGGGGGGATNLGYTESPTNGIVTSSTGTDATIPLADGTNTGLSENNLSDALKTAYDGAVSGVSYITAVLVDFENDINDINTELTGKQDTLTFDSAPTSGSINPVTSDGVFTALGLKQDSLTATDYSAISTIVGFSSFDTKYLMIQDFAGLMIINYQISGTSNATNFTFTIPNSVPTQQFRTAYVRNNGTFVTSTALIQGSGTTVTIFNGTSTFTASGTKSAYGTIILFK